MVARTVRMQLKPNRVAEFTRTLAHAIIPLLRQQPGFQDEMAFVVPGGTAAVRLSVWDQQEDAEAYARDTDPHVLQAVANVLEGTPQVDPYAVSNRPSTRAPRALLSDVDRALLCGEAAMSALTRGHWCCFLREN